MDRYVRCLTTVALPGAIAVALVALAGACGGGGEEELSAPTPAASPGRTPTPSPAPTPTPAVQRVAAEDLFRWEPEYSAGEGAANLEVTQIDIDGTLSVGCIDDEECSVPIRGGRFVADPLGSQNIRIAIDPKIGSTEYAGLRFEDEVTVNIWESGVVEVDREEVEATDSDGTVFISARVMVEGKEAIVMVRK
jgi:hypothetical protein